MYFWQQTEWKSVFFCLLEFDINLFFSFFLFFFFLLWLHLQHIGSSQARGLIGAVVLAYTTATAAWDPSCVCSLNHSSWAMLDPQPTERGLGSNPHPHGSQSDSLTTEPRWELQQSILNPLCHGGKSWPAVFFSFSIFVRFCCQNDPGLIK